MNVYINNVHIKSENWFGINVKNNIWKVVKQNNRIAGVEKLCKSSHEKFD